MTRTWRMNESLAIALSVVGLLAVVLALVYVSQYMIERDALSPVDDPAQLRELREVDKLSAEIRQIRSDTGGSLFWLKLVGVLVTVGGAVGGYLVGQSRSTRRRLEFEDRKKVDELYQQMVVELASPSELLRTAAAVKLGELLRAFPQEWQVSDSRRDELVQLTKQVLAASLAIEKEAKVLKTLTIQVVLHQPWADDEEATRTLPSLGRLGPGDSEERVRRPSRGGPLEREGRRRLLGTGRLHGRRPLPGPPQGRVASGTPSSSARSSARRSSKAQCSRVRTARGRTSSSRT